MRRSRVPLLLGALWALVGTQAVVADSATESFDRATLVGLSASVLQVEARYPGGYALGSGVAVGADRIVTNCHVTREASVIHVVRGGVRWRADAQAAAPALDLCVLRVPQLQAQAVTMGAADTLRIGQPMAALGYTGGMLQASAGHVIGLYPHAGSVVVRSTTSFTSGASGGALFDQRLQLVGILTFRLRGGEAHYFAAPVEWIAPLLVDGPQYQSVHPLPAAARAYWEEPAETRPDFFRCLAPDRSDRPEQPGAALPPCPQEMPA